MARRRDAEGPGKSKKDSLTIVVTTTPTYSAGSLKIARAHAATWSRKRQREDRLKVERQGSATAYDKSPAAKPHAITSGLPATSEVSKRKSPAAAPKTRKEYPRKASSSKWASPSLSIRPHIRCTIGDIEAERWPCYEEIDSVQSPTTLLGESQELNSDGPKRSSFLLGQLQTAALVPMPSFAACLDPFAIFPVQIDREMATLLRLYTNVILPRVRFHRTISKACSNLAAVHALRHPMVLYAILCRASIEPRPEDGDPRDGYRMYRASFNRGWRRESINFKLQAIKHLNDQIGTARLEDDHFPILHTISFLLRIETIHGNTQLIRAHLSGVQQLQALGVRLDNYAYCSVAPVIYTIYFACAMTRTPPPFAPPSISRDRVSQRIRRKLEQDLDSELNLTACGFWTPSVAEALGPDFLALVAKRRIYTLSREVPFNESVWPYAEEVEYFTLAELSVDYHLLLMLYRSTPSLLTPVQEYVCLAFLMFGHISSTSFEPASWWCWMRMMNKQLVNALKRTRLSDFWDQNATLLLWVLFIGAHAFHGQPDRPWFVAQLTRGINVLGLRSREEVRVVLAKFFYIDLYFGKSLDEIWAEARPWERS